MRRSWLIIVLILGAMLIGSPAAFAQYSSGGAGASAAAGVLNACFERLDNHVYTCTVKSSFGTTFTDTYTFDSATQTMSAGGLGFDLSCTCGTEGSFKKPSFQTAQKQWSCVGTDGTFAIAFTGNVKSGDNVTSIDIFNNNSPGDTFVADDCTTGP